MKRYGLLAYLVAVLLPLLFSVTAKGQEDRDSLVILMSAKSAQMVDVQGASYRKIIGPARFLHNGTYLICDTAFWNVDRKFIEAWGNVRILQEETVLDSDKLTYLIDEDLAQFRGTLVQLQDKEHNTLRTKHLDYNTKDSVAMFRNGGSMRDKDGQIIESRDGSYDSKVKTFTFSGDVNMFTDSIFVKTGRLKYQSELNLATFSSGTDAWKDSNMLSASDGWYDREKETFFFRNKVHVMSQDQEGWCDSLYFYRISSDVDMLGNVQISDTTRNVYALAGRIHYADSSSTVTLTRKPAVITQTSEPGSAVDTVYMGAEKLVYRTIKKCDVDSVEVVRAQERLTNLAVDPVGTYRKQAADAAAKAAEEAAKEDPNYRPDKKRNPSDSPEKQVKKSTSNQESPVGEIKKTDAKNSAPQGRKLSSTTAEDLRVDGADSLAFRDSLQTEATQEGIQDEQSRKADVWELRDSIKTGLNQGETDQTNMELVEGDRTDIEPADGDRTEIEQAETGHVDMDQPDGDQTDADQIGDDRTDMDQMVPSDTLSAAQEVAVKDTTGIGFLWAEKNVRIFKKDMQVVCDSLLYNDLDSLARMFNDPKIWQERRRQYSADSIFVHVRQGGIGKASLMSNAFITIQEDTSHFDQIKGTEMLAYFGNDSALERFDVLGGATAVFFIEEQEALATVNKADSKMLSAIFKNGEIQKVHYYDQPKNDGYPVVQLSKEEQKLKGFKWEPDKRPASRSDITPLSLRPGRRAYYDSRPRAAFSQTDIYFPGYISDINRQIRVRDSLRVVRERENREAMRLKAERQRLDSLASADSIPRADSLLKLAAKDSLMSVAASVKDTLASSLTPSDTVISAPAVAPVLTKQEIKAKKEAEREARRKERLEKKEKKWEKLDNRDAIRQQAEKEKKLQKLRKKKRKALEDAARQAEKDRQALERYRKKYLRQKERKEGKLTHQ